MTDLRSVGARLADGVAGAAWWTAERLVQLVLLTLLLGVPVGVVYMAAHFVLKYW